MGKLPSLITDALGGEALSYYDSSSSIYAIHFKQTFEVTQNTNFTWTVKSTLYIKIPTTYTVGGQNLGTCWINIGGQRYDIQEVQIMTTGVWVRGSQISNNPYEWTKILEGTNTFSSETGRLAIRLRCGQLDSSGNEQYLDDYTIIYLTLPSFSGAWYKINNKNKNAMVWIKVNGEWKKALQYAKINGKWKQSKQLWLWNPE